MKTLIKLIILAGLVFAFMLVYGIFDMNSGFMKDINSLDLEIIVATDVKYVEVTDSYFVSAIIDNKLYAGFLDQDTFKAFQLLQNLKGDPMTSISYLWAILFVVSALITICFPQGKRKRV